MKKGTTFTGKVIGLFFGPDHKKIIDLILNELKDEGATVRVFHNEKEIIRAIWEDSPKSEQPRPGAVIFSADITTLKTIDDMNYCEVSPISVLFRPKALPTVSVSDDVELNTTLSIFVRNIFDSQKYKTEIMGEKVEEKV